MQLIKNYAYNTLYQIFILIVPLVTTPYLSRVFGPTGVGINDFTYANTYYFIIFGGLGMALFGSRQIAYVRNNKAELSATFYDIFSMRLVTMTIAFLFFLVFLYFVPNYRIYYFAQGFAIIAAIFDISWFFQGMENFAVTVTRNVIIKLITLVCVFTLIKSPNDLFLYILIISLSTLIGNLTLFPYLKKTLYKPQVKNINIWRYFLPILILFIPEIASQVYLVVNKTMLGILTNVQEVGNFGQSDKIIKLLLAVATALGAVMLPHAAAAFAEGKYNQVKKYLYYSFQFISSLAIPLCLGVAAVAHSFVPLFFSTSFMPVVPLLIVESLVIIFISWSNVIGMQYLLPTNQNKAYNTSIIIGAVVNIVLNIPFILLWQALGTTIVTVISEFSVTAYQLYVIRSQVSLKRLFFNISKYFVIGLIMFVIVAIMNFTLPGTWLMLIIEAIVGVIIYLIGLLILRFDFVKNVIKNYF